MAAIAKVTQITTGETTMSERLEVAVARLEEKMDTVKEALDDSAADRKAQAERLGSLERQQERHADATAAVLQTINRQLADFITDSKRTGSESQEAIRTLSSRLKPLEDDLSSRMAARIEEDRRAAAAERNVRRLRNSVGVIAALLGMLIAAKTGVKTFMAWLFKAAS